MSTDATIKQLVDEVYLVPSASADNYIDVLLEVCKKEKVDILIPGISQELPQLQERRAEFEQIGTLVSVSVGEGLLIANDKIKLYQFMKENGFSIPNFRTAKNIEEFVAPEMIAHYLATGYYQNAIYEESFDLHVRTNLYNINYAFENINLIKSKIKDILRIKYFLLVVEEEPVLIFKELRA